MAEAHGQSGGDSHAEEHGGGGGHVGGHAGGHGGGGSHAEGEHEGAPEWLISFADNVALMMGFFVILLAMNMAKPSAGGTGGEDKNPGGGGAVSSNPAMDDFALAVRKAFNNPVDINSEDPREASLVKRLRDRESNRQGDAIDPGPTGEKHDVQAVRPTDFFNIAGFVQFDANEDVLRPDGEKTLEEVSQQLRGLSWMVELRGHVSAAESRRDKPAAMALAYRRALATANKLVESGVRWEQLRVVACADNERATPHAHDTAGHQDNQRVEIVVTQEQVPHDPYASPAP